MQLDSRIFSKSLAKDSNHLDLLWQDMRRTWHDQKFAILMLLAALPISTVIGYGMMKFGLLTLALGLVMLGLMFVIKLQNDIYLYIVSFLLCGYLFLSKGFAVIGVFPVYVSEFGLAAGIGTTVVLFFINRKNLRLKPLMHFEVAILLLFLLSQLPATYPYFGEHGMNVVRDAMQYLYAIYTLCMGVLLPKSSVDRMMHWYFKSYTAFVVWAPIFFMLSRAVEIPIRFPGASVGIITTKGSDLAVHVGAAAAYMLLRLDRYQDKEWSQGKIWFHWLWLGIGLIIVAIFGRSAMLAALGAMFVAFVIRPSTSWFRPIIMGAIGVALLVVTGWYTAEIDVGISRKISVEQFMLNLSSIVGEGTDSDSHGSLEGTKQWRLNWWTDIINYTFFGEYFMTGKGYGVSLADSDGYQVGREGELRAPHNGNLTFLARSGVPGFILWMLYLVASLLFLLRQIFSAATSEKEKHYAIWFLAYNVGFHIVFSFDVLMESPMGGIWYWALQGMMFVYFTNPDKKAKLELTAKQKNENLLRASKSQRLARALR